MTLPSPSTSSQHELSHEHIAHAAEKVVILYASETGNAQDTAERVGREFRRVGRRCTVLSMDMFDVFQLPDTPLLILITSTHGRGDPPPAMSPLWTALLRTSLPPDILEDVSFALYGLGDSSYERFCYAGKMLARRMESLGASRLGEYMWGDERAPDGIEETFVPWLKQTVEAMSPLLPVVDDHKPYTVTDLPPPMYSLSPASDHHLLETELNGLHLNSGTNGHSVPPRVEDIPVGHDRLTWTKPADWVWAKLTKNERVTGEGWWQDVREIELEFEDHATPAYEPGSICSLQPRLSQEEVDLFLEINGLQKRADEVIYLRSNDPDQPLPPHLPPTDHPTSLRTLLTHHLDIRSPPRKSFFEWLRRLSPEERERERLDEFIADPDEIFTYATRPRRSIVETLQDFRETKVGSDWLLEVLPPLRRRQFSIASSYEAHPGKVQLLVALVEYRTNLKIPRRGLCSSWLDRLQLGTRIPLHIASPTLFLPNPSTPVILVGPGTGVAPMRAFVEARVKQGAIDNTILYFGCRSASQDLYYKDEWDGYRRQGVRIEIAASRDQDEKVYVQHLIKRDKELVKVWVEDRGGHLYISGSSNSMPKEVRAAVAWCLTSDGAGSMSSGQAEAYVERMFEDGRGGEESW